VVTDLTWLNSILIYFGIAVELINGDEKQVDVAQKEKQMTAASQHAAVSTPR